MEISKCLSLSPNWNFNWITSLDHHKQNGRVKLMVCRPSVDERIILDICEINSEQGLVGDNWALRGQQKIPPKPPNSNTQINLMNSRVIETIAKDKNLWPLAGDQFFVDLDLSAENLPSGTQLQIGSAIIEITAEPHLGCKKFMERFGKDAVVFMNSDEGKKLNLRGVNAKLIAAGKVKVGDEIKKISNFFSAAE